MIDFTPFISINTLNSNSISRAFQSQKLSCCIKRKNQLYVMYKKHNFKIYSKIKE